MQITFNTHTFTVSRSESGLFSLKDIEKGWRQSGGKGKRLDHWLSSPTYCSLSKLTEFRVVKLEGRQGGTWGNELATIEYATYCSPQFRLAVLVAFNHLTRGEVNKAAKAATKVVISRELVDTARKAELNLRITLEHTHPDEHHTLGQTIANYLRLACKCATGYPSKVLTGGGVSAVEHMYRQGHQDCLVAYIACLECITKLKVMNLKYHDIAFILGVQTQKNKMRFAEFIDVELKAA